METFTLVMFWLFVAGFLLRGINAAAGQEVNVTVNTQLANMILKIPFIIWAGYLLWGSS